MSEESLQGITEEILSQVNPRLSAIKRDQDNFKKIAADNDSQFSSILKDVERVIATNKSDIENVVGSIESIKTDSQEQQRFMRKVGSQLDDTNKYLRRVFNKVNELERELLETKIKITQTELAFNNSLKTLKLTAANNNEKDSNKKNLTKDKKGSLFGKLAIGAAGIAAGAGLYELYKLDQGNRKTADYGGRDDNPMTGVATGGYRNQSQYGVRDSDRQKVKEEETIDATSVGKLPSYGKSDNGALDRSAFAKQLEDPEVLKAFAGRMHSEVGSQGAEAQQAWAETVFNRATNRYNNDILRAITDPPGKSPYYPTPNPGSSDNKDFQNIIKRVQREGTDITQGSTGNASGGVGFDGGPLKKRINGEDFGQEGSDIKLGWLKKYNSLKGAPVLSEKTTSGELDRAKAWLQDQMKSKDTPEKEKGDINDKLDKINDLQNKLQKQIEDKQKGLGKDNNNLGLPGEEVPEAGDTSKLKFNRFSGAGANPEEESKNIVGIDTPYGPASVHKSSALAYKGFFNDMNSAGAPIDKLGSYNVRQKRSWLGGHGWSEHSFGNAIDLNDAVGFSPTFEKWLKDNPGKFEGLLNKWGMKQGIKGDPNHVEFGGKISPEAREEVDRQIAERNKITTGVVDRSDKSDSAGFSKVVSSLTHNLTPQEMAEAARKNKKFVEYTPGSEGEQYTLDSAKKMGMEPVAYHRGMGNKDYNEKDQSSKIVIDQISKINAKYIHLDNTDRMNYNDFKSIVDFAKKDGKIIIPKNPHLDDKWERYLKENPGYKAPYSVVESVSKLSTEEFTRLKKLKDKGQIGDINGVDWEKSDTYATSAGKEATKQFATDIGPVSVTKAPINNKGQGDYDFNPRDTTENLGPVLSKEPLRLESDKPTVPPPPGDSTLNNSSTAKPSNSDEKPNDQVKPIPIPLEFSRNAGENSASSTTKLPPTPEDTKTNTASRLTNAAKTIDVPSEKIISK